MKFEISICNLNLHVSNNNCCWNVLLKTLGKTTGTRIALLFWENLKLLFENVRWFFYSNFESGFRFKIPILYYISKYKRPSRKRKPVVPSYRESLDVQPLSCSTTPRILLAPKLRWRAIRPCLGLLRRRLVCSHFMKAVPLVMFRLHKTCRSRPAPRELCSTCRVLNYDFISNLKAKTWFWSGFCRKVAKNRSWHILILF